MRIHELERRAQILNQKLKTLGQTLERRDGKTLKEWREARLELAIIEDELGAMRAHAEALREKSNLGKRFAFRTFDNFDTSENERAFSICKRYVDNHGYDGQESNSLLLCGDCGTGKTHLAAAIANRLLEEGVPTLFDTYGGHLHKLKAEFDSRGEPRYLKQLQTVDMLIIDDIGKERQSEWSRSIMYDVLNSRYEDMLPVIITSNFKSTSELEEYIGKPCCSRLMEMCVIVTTTGKDRRIQ